MLEQTNHSVFVEDSVYIPGRSFELLTVLCVKGSKINR